MSGKGGSNAMERDKNGKWEAERKDQMKKKSQRGLEGR